MNARVGISEDEAFGSNDRQIAQLRVPPNSIEAESSVLGGLLQDNARWDGVGDLITDSDFYRYEHKVIYGAIGQLVNACKPADVVTVFEHLQRIGKHDEVGGLVYLNALAQYVPSAANIRRYAEIVRERSILRRLISAADETATNAFNTGGKPVQQILDEAQQRFITVGEAQNNAKDEWHDVDRGIVRVLDFIQEHASGDAKPDFTPTGLKELDERLDGGMRGGELIVLGARPSMGKSALGMSISAYVAMNAGLPVGAFSMEMPAMQMHKRLMSLVSKIHLSRIKRPERLRDEDWPSITEAVEMLRQCVFDINDQSGLNITQLRAKARALRRRRGKLGCLMVDYLSLMDGLDPRATRAQQLGEITKGLKGLALELDTPILLLQQVGRGAEDRHEGMPILRDLKDSGSIEQDADIVVFIHRPIKDTPDLADEWKYYAKASLAKVRDGEPGYFDLMYVGENTHFLDWPETMDVPKDKTRIARASTKAKKGL
jgi:replicative DNA helicase